MTPLRFAECLNLLGANMHEISRSLGCRTSLVEAWCNGDRRIPMAISVWLEGSAKRGRLGDAPETWKRGGFSGHRVPIAKD